MAATYTFIGGRAVRRRDPVLTAIAAFLTCGLWMAVWTVLTSRTVHRLMRERGLEGAGRSNPVIIVGLALVLPIAAIGGMIAMFERGVPEDDPVYLLLLILAFGSFAGRYLLGAAIRDLLASTTSFHRFGMLPYMLLLLVANGAPAAGYAQHFLNHALDAMAEPAPGMPAGSAGGAG